MDSNVGIAVLLTQGIDNAKGIFKKGWPSGSLAFINKLKDPTTKELYMEATPFFYQAVNNPARLRNAALWAFRDKEHIIFVEDFVLIKDKIIFDMMVSVLDAEEMAYTCISFSRDGIRRMLPGLEVYRMDACQEVGALNLTLSNYMTSWRDYVSRIDVKRYEPNMTDILSIDRIDKYVGVQDERTMNALYKERVEYEEIGQVEFLPLKEPEGVYIF